MKSIKNLFSELNTVNTLGFVNETAWPDLTRAAGDVYDFQNFELA
jgi:hypothetical protein